MGWNMSGDWREVWPGLGGKGGGKYGGWKSVMTGDWCACGA